MNKRDLNLLRLGRENPKALDLLLKVSELLEVQSPAAISQEDLSREIGINSKTVALLLENLKDLVHYCRAGDLWIFSSRDISWKEEAGYETLKVTVLRKASGENAGKDAKEEKPAPASAPAQTAPAASSEKPASHKQA